MDFEYNLVKSSCSYIKKKNVNAIQAKIILVFEFRYSFLFSGIRDLFHLPNFISYIFDVLNVFLLFLFFGSKRKTWFVKKVTLDNFVLSILFCLACVTITAFVNSVDPLLYIRGIRNFFRFFIFIICLIFYSKKSDLEKYCKIILFLQIPNLIITLFQFFVLSYEQDTLGGIFGTSVGVNASTNIFLCLSFTMMLQFYLNKKISLFAVSLSLISWIIIISLSEIKVAFIEIPLIVLATILFNKPNTKTFLIIFMTIFGLLIGLNIIVLVFPKLASIFEDFFSLIKVGFGTGGGYNISRLNAYAEINNIFFDNDVLKNIFGFGFGNCEYSSFSFLVSDFYRAFGHYNYRWFTNQMLFLESGFLGVVSYISIFCVLFMTLIKYKKRYRDSYGFGSFGLVYIVLLIINYYYNSSLITDVGYLSYIGVAIPLIYYKNVIFEKPSVKE